jgi:DNA-binding transcriptional LysR family regulator
MSASSPESLAGIRLFVDVARTESFSETARHLGLAPSSVTRQIDGLEQALGVRLLNRSTRRITLTEAGRLYLEHAQRIVIDVDDARAAVGALQAMPRGTLRVSAPVVFGRMHLGPLVARFLEQFPEVRLDLRLNDQMASFVDDGIDVAVRIADLPDSTLIARQLVSLERVICASPAYLEAHGTPAQPSDLTGHHCLTFRYNVFGEIWRAGSRSWQLSEQPCIPGAGDAPTMVNIDVGGRLQTNNADMLIQAALDGLGIVLLPSWAVCDHVRAGRLVRLLPEHVIGPLDHQPAVYAVYPSARYLSPKIRAFIDFFAEQLKLRNL